MILVEKRPRILLFSALTAVFAALFALALSEALCRVAGVGAPNRTLTGPKQLYVPDPDPLIRFRLRPDYNDYVYGSQVKINSKGLRDVEVDYEKPQGVKRVMVLGDSVAFGYGANVEDTFSDQWERLLNDRQPGRWQIINSGVPSYTTVQEVRWLETEGLKYQPDAVVVAYIMNDPEPVHQLDANGRFVPQPIDAFYQEIAGLFPKPILPFTSFSSLARFSNRLLLHTHPNWKTIHHRLTDYFCEDIFETQGWDDCVNAMNRLRTLCDEHNIPLLVAIYPTMHRLLSREEHPFTPHYDKAKKTFSAAGIDCVSTLDDYIGESVDAMRAYVDDPHPSAASHLIFAKRLRRETQTRWDGNAMESLWKPDGS